MRASPVMQVLALEICSMFTMSLACSSLFWDHFTFHYFLHRPHILALLYAGKPLNSKLIVVTRDSDRRTVGVNMEQL